MERGACNFIKAFSFETSVKNNSLLPFVDPRVNMFQLICTTVYFTKYAICKAFKQKEVSFTEDHRYCVLFRIDHAYRASVSSRGENLHCNMLTGPKHTVDKCISYGETSGQRILTKGSIAYPSPPTIAPSSGEMWTPQSPSNACFVGPS